MLEHIKKATENIDWRFVRLSRLDYRDSREPLGINDPRWQERPFAYELYHQLRLIFDKGEFDMECLVQAEVLKTYQAIKDLDKMPDLLFHVPDSQTNLAVAEIKLASNPYKSLEADLDKLTLFHEILGYQTLVEIVVGKPSELPLQMKRLERLKSVGGIPIDVLIVPAGGGEVLYRRIGYRPSGQLH